MLWRVVAFSRFSELVAPANAPSSREGAGCVDSHLTEDRRTTPGRDEIRSAVRSVGRCPRERRSLKVPYGRTVAVDGLSFRVEAGRVTGFVGPNGAGKSTTMRLVLGLDRPAGVVRVGGRHYHDLRAPLCEVGASSTQEQRTPAGSAQPSPMAREEQPPTSGASARLSTVGLSEAAPQAYGRLLSWDGTTPRYRAAMLGDPPSSSSTSRSTDSIPTAALDPAFCASSRPRGRAVPVSSHR